MTVTQRNTLLKEGLRGTAGRTGTGQPDEDRVIYGAFETEGSDMEKAAEESAYYGEGE